jgi:hypothetical protein
MPLSIVTVVAFDVVHSSLELSPLAMVPGDASKSLITGEGVDEGSVGEDLVQLVKKKRDVQIIPKINSFFPMINLPITN